MCKLVAGILLIISLNVWAEVPAKPEAKSFVSDEAGILRKSDLAEINKVIKSVFVEKATPIYVVTIHNIDDYLKGASIEQLAYLTFNTWGIGYSRHDFGLLLLVAIEDRKVRIELGKGWPSETVVQTDEILNDLILPNFKNDDYSYGVLAGVKGLASLARGESVPVLWLIKPWQKIAFIGSLVFLLFISISCFRHGQDGIGWIFIGFIVSLLGFLLYLMNFIVKTDSDDSGSGMSGGSSSGSGSTGSW